MKRSPVNFVKTAVATLVFVVMALSTTLYSQVGVDDITGSVKVTLKKNAVENLKVSIGSDNPGVKKSAIYYAGYYTVTEAVGALMDQLRIEKDPSVKILIALSLYKLNDRNALNLIKELSAADSDAKVRRMCSAIYNEYLTAKNRVAVK